MRHTTPAIDYIRKLYATQDALLAEIDDSLQRMGMHINIGAEEGKLLQMLITLHQPKHIIEIGTLAGYSTLWMARALPEGGHITTINKDPQHIAMARDFFARSDVGDLITMLEGDAHDVLPKLSSPPPPGGRLGGGHYSNELSQKSPHPSPPSNGEGIKFDMIFIDADKISYNDYLDWAEANIRTGGLIVADNTLLHGAMELDAPPPNVAPTTWHAMRRFNERLADPKKYFATIIPTQEGMTVAVKL